jgi:hypothetical protein
MPRQEMKAKNRASLLVAIVAVLLAVAPAAAQNITGEIDGRVLDPTGAVIPGAVITITNLDTKEIVRTLKSGAHGEYSAPLLPVGNYVITATAPNFATAKQVVQSLGVGDAVQENLNMAPAGTTVDVTVSATDTSLAPNLENNENSTTISNVQVNELALNTRNFEQLIQLAPGVVYNGPDQLYPGMTNSTGAATASNFAIDGLQYAQITWLLDGSDILNHNGNNQTSVYPSVDAVNQIKIIRNGYGAEYGGAGSAQVGIVSKTGSSAYHGDAYFFFRNEALDANNFFNLVASPQLPRPTLRYNDYGGTIGGPVFIPHLLPKDRSKTFFFFSEEIRRIGQAPTQTFTNFPTAPQTNGYFAHPTAQTGTTAVTNSPYPGYNYHITTAINSVAQAYIKDIIDPAIAIQPVNNPNDPQGIILEQRSTTSETQELVRLDHQFNQRLSMFIRYIDDPINLMVPNQYNGAGNGFPGASNTTVPTFGKNAMAHFTFTLTPNAVIEGAYSYQPYGIQIIPTGTLLSKNSPDVQVTLPYPTTVGRVPNLAINGTPNWTTRGPADDEDEAHQAFVNVTLVRGRHNILFGGNYEYTARTANQGLTNAGAFTFTGAKNATTGETAYEAAFSNFLAGKVNTFTQASVDAVSINAESLWEAYVQDNWRATPRLSVNLGVRYSIYGQPNDELGHLGVFQPEQYNAANAPTVSTATGGICTAVGTGCPTINAAYNKLNGVTENNTPQSFGGAISTTPHNDFAPRFGFAYNLTGDGKASLRGGYGIFFNQTQLNLAMTEVDGNPAYVQSPVYTAPASFANPAAGTPGNPAVSLYGQQRNWKQAYTQGFNLDMQIQFPHQTQVDIGYVGNTTQHIVLPLDFNQPTPGYYAAASGVTAYPAAGATTTVIDAYRPYKGYETIFYYSPSGFADYNGLQASMNKRFNRRSLISLSYTWSKSMADDQTLFVAPQNTYDHNAEWGPSFQDRRNVFVGNFVYELPTLRGKNVFARETLGGWELSGIVIAESGQWGTVTQNSADPAGQGILATSSPAQARLDMVSDPNVGGMRNVAGFFNKNAFQQVPAGLFRPGNEKRNAVEGPGEQTWNIDVFRNFSLPHDNRLQFRAESFNLFNHVNYTTVQIAFNNGQFGQVTAANDMRILQVGVKLYY